MKDLPGITIITPSLNQGMFLEQCIDSVLSQNYPNLEFIIVDGGSKDYSADIIKKYEKYLSWWVSEPDKGQSNAINKGLKKANGEVINWLNSDDYLKKGALKQIGEYFKNDNIDVLCGKSHIIDIYGRYIKTSKGTDIYSGNLAKTIGWARIDQPETYFRKKAFEQTGLLNESLHYLMDKEWWIRFLLHSGIEGIKKTEDKLVNFRMHNQSKSQSQAEEFKKEGYQLYLNLALQNQYQKGIDLFEELGIIPNKDYQFNFPKVKTGLLQEIYNYLFLYLLDYHYYHHDLETASKIIRYMDKNLLNRSDLSYFNKLSFKYHLKKLWSRIS